LTSVSYIPVIPGVIKINMGSLQMIIAFLATFVTTCRSDLKYRSYSIHDIKHGIVHIFAGVLEAVSVVGCYFSYQKNSQYSQDRIVFRDETTNKIFPYELLRGERIKF